MTKYELLKLAVLDDSVTIKELADALNSVLPELQIGGESFMYWRSGEEFASMKRTSNVTYVECDDHGAYDFNGGHIAENSDKDMKIVSLSEWVAAIREAFKLED